MPAPKYRGKIPVTQGIKHNGKFNFWVAYQCFNTLNIQDKTAYFVTEQEAQNYFNNLNH